MMVFKVLTLEDGGKGGGPMMSWDPCCLMATRNLGFTHHFEVLVVEIPSTVVGNLTWEDFGA